VTGYEDRRLHKFCSCFLAGPRRNRRELDISFEYQFEKKQFIISQLSSFKCLWRIRQVQ
jgi:hypothetical protein